MVSFNNAADPTVEAEVHQTLVAQNVRMDEDEALELLSRHYGIQGSVHRLAGERDDNFRVSTTEGASYFLKVAHVAEQPVVTDFQTQVLLYLAEVDPTLPVPRIIRTVEDQVHATVGGPEGSARTARLTSFLNGTLLGSVASTPALRRNIGQTLGQLNLALAGFNHEAADAEMLWDVARAGRLNALVAEIESDQHRGVLQELGAHFTEEVEPRLRPLRRQVVHNDFSGHNLLAGPKTSSLSGILDFGDMTRTQVVVDLAVAAAYQLGEGPDPLSPALDVIAGYHQAMPLLPAEAELLFDVMITRMYVRLAITEWRAPRFPENRDYILRNNVATWRILESLRQMSPGEAQGRIEQVLR